MLSAKQFLSHPSLPALVAWADDRCNYPVPRPMIFQTEAHGEIVVDLPRGVVTINGTQQQVPPNFFANPYLQYSLVFASITPDGDYGQQIVIPPNAITDEVAVEGRYFLFGQRVMCPTKKGGEILYLPSDIYKKHSVRNLKQHIRILLADSGLPLAVDPYLFEPGYRQRIDEVYTSVEMTNLLDRLGRIYSPTSTIHTTASMREIIATLD